MGNTFRVMVSVVAVLTVFGCMTPRETNHRSEDGLPLIGAWRSNIQFETGAFATIKDLEFMYVYNTGGTMTESSNYDAAPPVPPAYGIWRTVGPNEYEAKYEFYMTRPPAAAEAQSAGGGWLSAGRGILVETISLSKDGNSFSSKIQYQVVDQAGKAVAGSGSAKGRAVRIQF